MLAVADLPEAKDSIIFNIRVSDDVLRQEQCRFDVFHVAPSSSMRADALAQYLIWKKWPKWFVLKGTAPSDKDYDAAVKRAAGRFGGKIVEQREYTFDTANPRTDSGHQQIQTQMPEVTQGAPEHDVVWVVDTTERVEPEGMGVSPDSKFTVATSESTSMAHVIDNATQKLVANVLVDTRPREAKFTPDGKQAWVSSEVGGTISVIDTGTWKAIKKINFAVPGVRPELLQPVGMEFTKDGKLLFVALGPGNRVAVIDPKTYEVKDYILVGQRPWHLELSPDNTKLYVANGLTNDMTVIDVASLKAEKSVPVGRLPWGVAIVP